MGTTKHLRLEIGFVDILFSSHHEDRSAFDIPCGGGAVLIEIFCKSCFEELQRIHEGIQPLGAAKMLTLFFLFLCPHFKESPLKKSEAVFKKKKKNLI